MTFEAIRQKIEDLLYPQLRPYRRNERDRLLRKASEMPLDHFEWIGILAALIVVVALTRYSAVQYGFMDRIGIAIANFVMSMLLLVVTAGPFLIRRTRRGLSSQLD